MKKQTKIIIGLASIVLLASLILLIIFIFKKGEEKKTNPLETKFSDVAVKYYKKEIEPYVAKNYSNHLGYYIVNLNDLKQAKEDVSLFIEKNCDVNDTYVKFVYTEGTDYKTETHLACDN